MKQLYYFLFILTKGNFNQNSPFYEESGANPEATGEQPVEENHCPSILIDATHNNILITH